MATIKKQQQSLTRSQRGVLQTAINRLWRYVRTERDNLDSGKVCARIEAIVDLAVAACQNEIQQIEAKCSEKQKRIRQLQSRIREMEKLTEGEESTEVAR